MTNLLLESYTSRIRSDHRVSEDDYRRILDLGSGISLITNPTSVFLLVPIPHRNNSRNTEFGMTTFQYNNCQRLNCQEIEKIQRVFSLVRPQGTEDNRCDVL